MSLEILPSELERELFEVAYRCNPSDALNLKLVAQRVRVWIDLLVYETVKLLNQRSASGFLEAARQKESAFFAAVKKLTLAHDVLPTQAVEIVSLCTAVEQLACWVKHDGVHQLPLLIQELPLRHLSIEHEHFVKLLAVASSPWTLNLTHVELVFWDETTGGLRFTQQLVHDLCKLPRLTHVALPSLKFRDGVQKAHMDLITSGLPNLFVVIILLASTDYDLEGNFFGGCVVEILQNSVRDVWEVYHSEENNLWARAEHVLAAQQEAAKEPGAN